jgi:hypothetical protein
MLAFQMRTIMSVSLEGRSDGAPAIVHRVSAKSAGGPERRDCWTPEHESALPCHRQSESIQARRFSVTPFLPPTAGKIG